jgi:hypothetical protein
MIFEGGCLCGDVRYACEVESADGYLCHCSDCRRTGGGPYTASLRVPAAGLRLLAGEPVAFQSRADSGNPVLREHCGRCGSPLFSGRPETGWRVVRLGSLDDPAQVRIRGHIWVRSALPWALPDDGLPRWERGAEGPAR